MHAEDNTHDETNALAQANDLADQAHVTLTGKGLADVLFPASPPTPVSARVIRLFSAEGERKPRDLASAAGLLGVRKVDPNEAKP